MLLATICPVAITMTLHDNRHAHKSNRNQCLDQQRRMARNSAHDAPF
jgi:ribosomal protein L44E